MKLAVVVNVLDMVAFFLVTIDLYGKERLASLSSKMRNFRLRARAPLPGALRRAREFDAYRVRQHDRNMFFATLLAVVVLWWKDFPSLQEDLKLGGLWTNHRKTIVEDAYISALLLLAAGVLPLLPRAMKWIAHKVLDRGFEGSLLLTGAATFVVSRSIAMWDAIQP